MAKLPRMTTTQVPIQRFQQQVTPPSITAEVPTLDLKPVFDLASAFAMQTQHQIHNQQQAVQTQNSIERRIAIGELNLGTMDEIAGLVNTTFMNKEGLFR